MSPDAFGDGVDGVAGSPVSRLRTVPAGWALATLDGVTASVAKVNPAARGIGFTYIDLGAVQTGVIRQPQKLQPQQAPSRARQLVEGGDTLFSGVRVYLKNIGLVGADHDGAIASTAFCVLRPKHGIDGKYLYYFVSWQPFINSLLPFQRGNSPPAVLDADIKAQSIPLPPTPEQRRIVARIDELFAEIAEGEAALERVRELGGKTTGARSLTGQLRQSILKAAFEGRLVSQDPSDEPASALLARLRENGASGRVIPKRGRHGRIGTTQGALPL